MSEKYQKLALIGAGSFGKAWLVSQVGSSKKMVSKEVRVTQLTEKESEQCITEVMVLAHCNHGNIIQYIDAFVEEKCLHIVMEFADGGDMQRKILKQNGIYFDKEMILNWFVQITMALEYIHKRNILHRDLKSQNVFLTGNDIIKLGDFGIAKVLQGQNDHAITTIGTPFYISPEICQKKPYNSSSDMWAAGCLLFEMCLLRMPFNAPDFTSLVLKILQGTYDPIPSYFGPLIQHLVSSLLLVQPSSRLSASEVLKMPDISVIVKKLLLKHSDLYKDSRSISPFSYNKQRRCQKSGLPKDDRLSKESNTVSAEEIDEMENKMTNKGKHFVDRGRPSLIKSTHQVRSLTPDLRRGQRFEREHSEPRRHSYSNNKDDSAKQHSISKSKISHNVSDRRSADENEGNKLKKKEKAAFMSRENLVDKKDQAETKKTKFNDALMDNIDRDSGHKVLSTTKKTYVIKESVLRRLSQASPVLSETIRQQRASLSLDTDMGQKEEVRGPTASLFHNKDRQASESYACTSKPPDADNSIDSVESCQDDVFSGQDLDFSEYVTNDMQDMRGSGKHGKVQPTREYETGPFDIELQRRRVDSTTYVVTSSASFSNNNSCTEKTSDMGEILYLAASVSKHNGQLARDIVHDFVVSHLGAAVASRLISMVTKQLETGQSYQSFVNSLSKSERELLPVVISMYFT